MKELPNSVKSWKLIPDNIECPWIIKGHKEVDLGGTTPQQAITAGITLHLIREAKAHVIINTGASATGETAVATIGDPADPAIIHKSKIRGTDLIASYE